MVVTTTPGTSSPADDRESQMTLFESSWKGRMLTRTTNRRCQADSAIPSESEDTGCASVGHSGQLNPPYPSYFGSLCQSPSISG